MHIQRSVHDTLHMSAQEKLKGQWLACMPHSRRILGLIPRLRVYLCWDRVFSLWLCGFSLRTPASSHLQSTWGICWLALVCVNGCLAALVGGCSQSLKTLSHLGSSEKKSFLIHNIFQEEKRRRWKNTFFWTSYRLLPHLMVKGAPLPPHQLPIVS